MESDFLRARKIYLSQPVQGGLINSPKTGKEIVLLNACLEEISQEMLPVRSKLCSP